MLLKVMMSPAGLWVDRFIVRWTGKSPLCKVFAKMGGFPARPALLLIVKGRKSGKPRASALPYFEAHGKLFVVGSRGGGPIDPQWVTNLRADPNATVYIDRKKHQMKARIAAGEERVPLWEELGKMLPTYVYYQTLTTREIPLVILE
jgi:deazaflavin-dependent oxidoreductase (nitroreductase family)